jgi:FkbM family methyltransferase
LLLKLDELIVKHNLQIDGVLHVGGHLAEEAPIYAAAGIENVWWVEANPDVIGKIRAATNRPEQVIKALVLDYPRSNVRFNVTNYDGMSSSVYNWGTHMTFSPDTVIDHVIYLNATTLDHLKYNYEITGVNFLNIDVEGANLDVLMGGTTILADIDYIYIEVQTENVYDGAPMLWTVDNYLAMWGFDRVELGMVEGQGWGDALFCRREY